MSFKTEKFLTDYNIQYESEGQKCTPNWLNLKCPFCGSRNVNLGIHQEESAANCWSCGPHKITDVIAKLANVSIAEAINIRREYSGKSKGRIETIPKAKIKSKICEFPYGTTELTERHKKYLEARNYDPAELIKIWGLQGTDHLGDYKMRILVPVIFDSKMVSFQGRDITGKAELKWKTCASGLEVIDHKTIFGGLEQCKGDSCVISEGFGDIWRLGKGSVCSFGLSFTTSQLNLLVSRFKRVFIMFDGEPKAIQQAEKLGCLLSIRGIQVEIIDISDTDESDLVDPKGGIDPGNLKQDYADMIMKELGFK